MQNGIAVVEDRAVAQESFEHLFAEWHSWMDVSRNLAPNTMKLYGRTIEIAQQDLGDLLTQTPESLEVWLRVKGGKAGTYSNRICALTNFYRFLVKTKRMAASPAAELERPKNPKGLPKPVENVEAVLAEMDRQDVIANEQGPIPRPVGQTRAMAVFLGNTGLRIHEAVALNVPVPAPASIKIMGKGRKEAIVQLNAKAREALDFLGGKWPIGARATQRRFEKVREVARVTPHMWRHTFATTLVRKGVEIGTVSKMCRHSSPATTMVYAAYAEEQMAAAAALLED